MYDRPWDVKCLGRLRSSVPKLGKCTRYSYCIQLTYSFLLMCCRRLGAKGETCGEAEALRKLYGCMVSTARGGPVSQLEDLMRRRGVDQVHAFGAVLYAGVVRSGAFTRFFPCFVLGPHKKMMIRAFNGGLGSWSWPRPGRLCKR